MNWLDYLNWSEMQTDELRSLGFAYLREGKYDLALVFFEALNVLEQDNTEDLQTLGALHLEKGNHEKALAYLDQSLEKENDPASLLFYSITHSLSSRPTNCYFLEIHYYRILTYPRPISNAQSLR